MLHSYGNCKNGTGSAASASAASASTATATATTTTTTTTTTTSTTTMTAVVAVDSTCVAKPWPVPKALAEEEVLIRVAATAINRLDTMQRRGKSPDEPRPKQQAGEPDEPMRKQPDEPMMKQQQRSKAHAKPPTKSPSKPVERKRLSGGK